MPGERTTASQSDPLAAIQTMADRDGGFVMGLESAIRSDVFIRLRDGYL